MKFEDSDHLPYTRTVGGGPKGRMVIFEVDKKKPEYVERLIAQFESNSI